jgi:hypothetical protein
MVLDFDVALDRRHSLLDIDYNTVVAIYTISIFGGPFGGIIGKPV